jgi:hypothetical protein
MSKTPIILLCVVSIAAAGCTSQKSQQPTSVIQKTPVIESLYRTSDSGDTWSERNALYVTGGTAKKVQYGTLNTAVFDPQDQNTIYLATDVGIYYTYNRGEGRFLTLTGKGIINDVVVDPSNKCTIYALAHDSIFKSTDCSRTWNRIHFTSTANEYFTAILISKSDPRLIFVGTSTGLLLRSTNAGTTWDLFQAINSPITLFLPHPTNPQSFIMVTPMFGIQRTDTNGATWVTLNDLPVYASDGTPMTTGEQNIKSLKDLSGTSAFYDLTFDASQKDGLIYASSYGIFRLINNDHWQELTILSKPSTQVINAVAMDTTNGQTIYFATPGAFYRSFDGGATWSVRTLPSGAIPKYLMLPADNIKEVIIGFIMSNS